MQFVQFVLVATSISNSTKCEKEKEMSRKFLPHRLYIHRDHQHYVCCENSLYQSSIMNAVIWVLVEVIAAAMRCNCTLCLKNVRYLIFCISKKHEPVFIFFCTQFPDNSSF